jgi:hypothetical protein
MKKLIFTLFAASLMLLATEASAQVSINAGYLNSTFKAQNADPENSNGMYLGASFNLPIVGDLAIAPGIYYSAIAAKGTLHFLNLASATGKFYEHAVNVPLYLNYTFELGRDTNFFLYGGPTAQYGVSSKAKLDMNTVIGDFSEVYDYYKDGDYNRFDVYLGGGVGFQVRGIMVMVGYDYGMLNQYKDKNHEAHRSNLKIGVGYAF